MKLKTEVEIKKIEKEIKELTKDIDKLEIDLIKNNENHENILNLYKMMLENIILEHHEACKKILK